LKMILKQLISKKKLLEVAIKISEMEWLNFIEY
jgi:hypothetical protein